MSILMFRKLKKDVRRLSSLSKFITELKCEKEIYKKGKQRYVGLVSTDLQRGNHS